MRSASCWFWASFSRPALATLRILPRSGRIAWVCAVARLLGRAAGRVALDDEDLGAGRAAGAAVGELAGQAELSRRVLAADLLLLAAAQALLGALDHPVEEPRRLVRRGGEPMVEGIADRVLDDARRLGGRQPVLGLADELRLADEDREERGGRGHDVVGGDGAGALVAGQLGVGLQALGQRGAEARLVGAALAGRDGVAVGADEAVAGEPGDRPFDGAVAAGLVGAAGEDRDDGLLRAELGGEIVATGRRGNGRSPSRGRPCP